MIAGFVGLIFLMVENWSDGPKRLNTVTLVFGIPAGICVALIIHGVCSDAVQKEHGAVDIAVRIPDIMWSTGTGHWVR